MDQSAIRRRMGLVRQELDTIYTQKERATQELITVSDEVDILQLKIKAETEMDIQNR